MRGFPSGIEIKTADQIALMRQAGLVVARALTRMREAGGARASRPRISTRSPRTRPARRPAASSSFLIRLSTAVPGRICASVNDESCTASRPASKLAEGDLLSIDFGAIVDGWHGDSAITVPVGEVAPDVRRALPGLRGVAVGRACRSPARRAAHRHLARGRDADPRRRARTASSTTTAATASAREMHMAPHILNYGRPGRGQRLVPGIALAIEPMVTLGARATRVLDDEWTVVTVDGSWAAHWEHTVAILRRRAVGADRPRRRRGRAGQARRRPLRPRHRLTRHRPPSTAQLNRAPGARRGQPSPRLVWLLRLGRSNHTRREGESSCPHGDVQGYVTA